MTETQPNRELLMSQLDRIRGRREVSSMRVSNTNRDLVKSIIEENSVIIEELEGRGCTGFVFKDKESLPSTT